MDNFLDQQTIPLKEVWLNLGTFYHDSLLAKILKNVNDIVIWKHLGLKLTI